MSSSNSSTLDLEQVQDASFGDPAFLRELVTVFLSDTTLRLESLRGDLQAQRTTSAARLACKLKGTSANVGARGLARCARKLEQMAEVSSVDQIEVVLTDLETEFDRVRNSFHRLIV